MTGEGPPGERRRLQAVKGTKDTLPDEVAPWHRIEAAARELFGVFV
jgi:hypothetical protein